MISNNYIAQRITNPTLGSLSTTSGASFMQRLATSLVGVLTVVGGFIFLFMVLSGAVAIIGSGGDKTAFENARKRITYGIIGIVVLVAAVFVVDVIATFLGIPNILNVQQMLNIIRL